MSRVKNPDGTWTDASSLSPDTHGAGPVTVIRPKAPTARQQEVWDAVQARGTQVAAAKALGVKQGSVQTHLRAYMAAKGIAGPLPGYAKGAYGEARNKTKWATPKPDNGKTRAPLVDVYTHYVSEADLGEPVPEPAAPQSAVPFEMPPGQSKSHAEWVPSFTQRVADPESPIVISPPTVPPRDLDVDRIALPLDMAADLLLDGLFGLLPEPGSVWRWKERDRWEALAKAMFAVLYRELA